jgi:hypothetical protein
LAENLEKRNPAQVGAALRRLIEKSHDKETLRQARKRIEPVE